MSANARRGGRISCRALALALVILLAAPAAAPAQVQSGSLAEGREGLLVRGERFGLLGDQHPATVLSRDIFQRLVRAAGRRPGVAFELYVLDTPKVIAEALPGGIVVISRGYLDLAKSDPNAMAFILGHEVAHLVRDHHGLLDSLGMLGAGRTPDRPGAAQEQVKAHKSVELEADRLGVLFAALAGYQPAAAVPALIALTNRMGPDRFHPDPKDRASAISDQITEVIQRLEVFHLGLFLMTSGRYLEAARVLEHFLTLFPSREVLSTVGVAYHKEALRHAPAPEYRHLLVIDPATRAPSTRGPGSPLFRQNMERAVHYYTLAYDADPSYAPASNNLAAAHLDLGDRELALGFVNRAIREDPRLASAYNNRALAYLLGPDKDYRRAEEDLLRAAQLDPALREVARNLVRLYETQGNGEKAARWRTAAAGPAAAAATTTNGGPEAIGNVQVGVPMNNLRSWTGEPGVRQIKVPTAAAGGDLTLLVFSNRGLVVLARSGVIDAIGSLPAGVATTRGGIRPGDPVSRVESAYGRPAGIDGVQAINLWTYPSRSLAVFVVNDRVQAAWIGRAR
jgi:tetratricopeptide (TPR) repeat protein